MIVNNDGIMHFNNFEVITKNDCIDRFNVFHRLSDVCKFSDHYVLVSEMCYSSHHEFSTPDGAEYGIHPPASEGTTACPKKDKLQNIPDMFQAGDIWHASLQELIEIFHKCENDQTQLDSNYDSFCDLLFQEMDTYLDLKVFSKNNRKTFRNCTGMKILLNCENL